MKKTLIAAAMAVCVAGPAFADADASIKYRQNSMKAVASQLGSIAAVLKGDIDNKGALAKHAMMLGAATSTDITVPAFKTNTDGKGNAKTTSTGAIWTDWAKFEAGLNDLAKAGQAAADAGANITFDHVKAVAATCKTCHQAFRQK